MIRVRHRADRYPNVTLTAAVQEPDTGEAFYQPAINVFIFTVLMGPLSTREFLDPDFFAPDQTAAVVQQSSDFTVYLSRA